MMEIRKVDDSFAVVPQMQPDELTALAAEGFTAVICNRPDGEEGWPSTTFRLQVACSHPPPSPPSLQSGAARRAKCSAIAALARVQSRSMRSPILAAFQPKNASAARRPPAMI